MIQVETIKKLLFIVNYMKKRVDAVAALVFVILSLFFLWILILSSNITVINNGNFIAMLLIAIAIWVFYVAYLWKILNGARRKSRRR